MPGVNVYFMYANRVVTIDDRGDMLPQQIVDIDAHITGHRQGIADRRSRIERIWVVLIQFIFERDVMRQLIGDGDVQIAVIPETGMVEIFIIGHQADGRLPEGGSETVIRTGNMTGAIADNAAF